MAKKSQIIHGLAETRAPGFVNHGEIIYVFQSRRRGRAHIYTTWEPTISPSPVQSDFHLIGEDGVGLDELLGEPV